MSRIRVLDLAKELGLDTKSAIVKLQDIGVQVKNHFNAISDIEADKLRMFVRSGKSPDKEAAGKSSAKVIIRRRVVESATADSAENEAGHTSAVSDEAHESAAPANAAATPESQVRDATRNAAQSSDTRAQSSTESVSAASQERVSEPTRSAATATPAARASASTSSGASPSAAAPQAGAISAPAAAAPSASLSNISAANVSAKAASGAGSSAPRATAPGASAEAGSADSSAKAPAAAPKIEGAVIVRRAEPVAPPPSSHSMGSGISINTRGSTSSGGVGQRPSPIQIGGQGQSGNTFRPGDRFGGPRPAGGIVGDGARSSNVYHAGQGGSSTGSGIQLRGAIQPRGEGGGEGGGIQVRQPGQWGGNSGGAAAGSRGPYVSREGGAGGGIRPAGSSPFGAPRPGGSGPMGGQRPPFGSSGGGAGGISTDTAPTKDGPSRATREKDKEKEIQKRRLQEEENRRLGKAAKSRTGTPGQEFEEFEGEFIPSGEDGEVVPVRTMIPNRRRGSSAMARKRDLRRQEPANPTKASKMVVRVDGHISVADLAAGMSLKTSALVKSLMKLGMLATFNQQIDVDTATLVAQEYGFEVQNTAVSISDILNTKKTDKTDTSLTDQNSRPPVITIMGHVDHGKTSLLDAIRSAKVADGEAGGITQHIGAYQVEHNGKKLTFLDTPGHEAFTSMRARGAQLTDIVILVVAADDGVMPQTIEAISHAKAANVPIIVAVNKMDRPGASLEKIQRELSTHNVTPEEWGGEAIFIPLSAKTREGIPELLEALLLQAEMLDLKAAEEGLASGIVVESKLDKARGPVCTVIVTQGTLKQSDWVVAGTSYGRVRAMFNDKGEKLSIALPAMPVEIIGMSEVPAAGDTFNCVVNDSIAKEAVAYRIEKTRQKELSSQTKTSLEDLLARLGEDSTKPKELALIVKADTHGSVEAIRQSLTKLDTPKVKTRFIHSAVGGITETDISLAQASDALVIGFNVRPDRAAATRAEKEKITIQCFNIIYELIDAVQNAMVGKLAPVKSEKLLGHAEVRSLFSVPKIGMVAGSAVTDGKIVRNAHIRVVRDNIVIYTGRVGSLRRFKDDAKEVVQGFECGIGVENYNDLKIGDVLEAFVIEETAATLH